MSTSLRTRALSVLLLGLVFVTGTLVGMAFGRDMDGSPLSSEAAATGPEGAADGGESAGATGDREDGDGARERRRPMYEQVGLSADQQLRVDSIVSHYRGEVRILQERSRDEYEAAYWQMVLATRSAIRGVLEPPQAMQYDSLLEASDRRRREREAERQQEATRDGGR